MALSKETINKLRQVQRAILAEPELYDQEAFVGRGDPCGTACCLAGWAIWQESPKRFKQCAESPHTDWPLEGVRALGLDSSINPWQLFDSGSTWPEPFSSQYVRAGSDKGRAVVASRRIDAFIESGGRV